MTHVLRIAVVDDHPLVRAGVVSVISSTPGYEVVAQGETASDAIRIVETEQPDILILDLSIPGGGGEALRQIQNPQNQTRVLILTVSEDDGDVFELLGMGAGGYVLKGVTGDELVHALDVLARGEQYVTPSLAAKMLAAIGSTRRAPVAPTLHDLAERERSIASLISEAALAGVAIELQRAVKAAQERLAGDADALVGLCARRRRWDDILRCNRSRKFRNGIFSSRSVPRRDAPLRCRRRWRIIKETRAASEPEAIARAIRHKGRRIGHVGLEAGNLSRWLYEGLAKQGFPVSVMEARRVRTAFAPCA